MVTVVDKRLTSIYKLKIGRVLSTSRQLQERRRIGSGGLLGLQIRWRQLIAAGGSIPSPSAIQPL